MHKGIWDAKIDIKSACIPFCCYVCYLIYIIAAPKLRYVTALYERDGTIFIGSDILFYFQFIVSFFVIIISSGVFEETYRPSANSFIRTLPLGVHQIWTWRYVRLLAAIYALLVPAVLLGVDQVNAGIKEFAEAFDLQLGTVALSPYPILLNCFASAAFILFLTQTALIITKHRMIADSFLFVYCIMEAGPLGNRLGQYDPFYECFSGTHLYSTMLPNFIILVILSLLFGIIDFIWYRSIVGTGMSASAK